MTNNGNIKSSDIHTLSHTKWNCKYHIVFAPKYRRKVFFENKRLEVGKILRDLCNWKGVNIIEGEVCPDHVHMFVENKVGGTCACTMSRACRTTAVCRRRYHQK